MDWNGGIGIVGLDDITISKNREQATLELFDPDQLQTTSRLVADDQAHLSFLPDGIHQSFRIGRHQMADVDAHADGLDCPRRLSDGIGQLR